jgi:threonine dehydratase
VQDQLNLINNSSVYEVIAPTVLQKTEALSLKLNTNIFLKREDSTLVHSFKIRGAYNKIANLNQEEKGRGIICASAGNHAQGVAYSAQKLKLKATIVMPATTPQIKVEAVKRYGAEVVLFGDNYSEAGDHAKDLQKQLNLTYVHPFDDKLVIAGQGTVGLELLDQLPNLTHIFVPVGGGGLLAGILSLVKELKPSVKVIAVEPEDSNCLQSALEAGKPVELSHVGIFADGVAVKQIGNKTFEVIKDKVDGVITVDNDQIALAIKQIFEETRSLVEPAGALSLAGLIKFKDELKPDDNSVAIVSGANIAFERLQFITERTMLASGQELLLRIKLKEKPGSLKNLLKDVIKKHNITEFAYRKETGSEAEILVGIQIKSDEYAQRFKQNLIKFNYDFEDLSTSDLAITHLRHMSGGGNLKPIITDNSEEIFLDCAFPERPGALAEFLSKMSSNWNISLFHYRGLGGDTGKVLLGIEVPKEDELKFSKFVDKLNNTGFKMFRLN